MEASASCHSGEAAQSLNVVIDSGASGPAKPVNGRSGVARTVLERVGSVLGVVLIDDRGADPPARRDLKARLPGPFADVLCLLLRRCDAGFGATTLRGGRGRRLDGMRGID